MYTVQIQPSESPIRDQRSPLPPDIISSLFVREASASSGAPRQDARRQFFQVCACAGQLFNEKVHVIAHAGKKILTVGSGIVARVQVELYVILAGLYERLPGLHHLCLFRFLCPLALSSSFGLPSDCPLVSCLLFISQANLASRRTPAITAGNASLTAYRLSAPNVGGGGSHALAMGHNSGSARNYEEETRTAR